MNWLLLRYFGLRYVVLGAGGTVGVVVVLAELIGFSIGLVALGMIGFAGILIVIGAGTSGASTAAAANEPGVPTIVTAEDAGVGGNPSGGIWVFFYAVGLATWSAFVLVLVSTLGL